MPMKEVTVAADESVDEHAEITAILQQYFEGLHVGNVDKLKSIFHEDTWLKAPYIRRSLSQWLHDVENRKSPAQLNIAFNFSVISIDIVQDQAMAKVNCPLFDFNYVDFLGLLKEGGKWKIVSKMYTDVMKNN